MIQQYVLAAAAGSAVTALLAFAAHKLHSAKLTARLHAEAQARIDTLEAAQAGHGAAIGERERAEQELQALTTQLRDELALQTANAEELRAALKAATEDKDQLAHQAQKIAGEAERLKSLGATFERWHEQMISLMTQNNDMHAKNQELSSIVRHVVIVSLNASIEAARAGPAGRGFAVVASEVRSLAQRSAAAAKEIKGLIDESTARVQAGSQLVERSGSTMTEIVDAIARVSSIMGEIAAAAIEQSTGIDQVNLAVAQMDEVTQQNAALVEQAAAAASSLEEQARRLTAAVSVFQTGSGATSSSGSSGRRGGSSAAPQTADADEFATA